MESTPEPQQPPENPELGNQIMVGNISTNYHDTGTGHPVLLIHGSGPGVSGWANWRLNIEPLAQRSRVLVPDMVGFGYTDVPAGVQFNLDTWERHLIGFLDALNIECTDIVGNSFGGALALAIAIRHPKRVRRLILMGSVGIPFELTAGLDAVWGYTPSVENMRNLLDVFAYNRELVSDELATLRYQASIRAGVQESFSQMFSPAPRQRFIEALASSEDQLRNIQHETLVLHGRNDQVIPVSASITLASLIPNAHLHVFPRCGHWTQIEWASDFNRMVVEFLA